MWPYSNRPGSIAYPKFWDQGFVVFKKNTKTIRFLHPCFKFSTDTAIRGQIELLQSGIYKQWKSMQIPPT